MRVEYVTVSKGLKVMGYDTESGAIYITNFRKMEKEIIV